MIPIHSVLGIIFRAAFQGMFATEIFLENVTDRGLFQSGNVRISVQGTSTYLTRDQRSSLPQISSKDKFGWSQWQDDLGHVLEIRKTGNIHKTVSTFLPARTLPHQQIIITNWGFTDKEKCLVISSTAEGLGYDCFIKYDIATGGVLDQLTEKTSFANLPKWVLWQLNPS